MSRPLAIKTIGKLNRVANKYFLDCDEINRPYTMSGLAYALGISRQNLSNYARKEMFAEPIALLKQRIEAQMEERMLTGQNASTPSIFSLKNNYGWHDKQQIEQHTVIDIKNLHNISTNDLLGLLEIDPANQAKLLTTIESKSKRPIEIEISKK